MKVILRETIDSLGIIGSEVKVADGYARNYLLPRGKAVEATPQNKKRMEHEKKKFELQIEKEISIAKDMAEEIKKISCTIAAKVIEGENLYGSVTVRDIVAALSKQDVKVEKRMILLIEPIKKVGEYKVPIRIYKGIKPEITVNVVPED